MKAQPSLPAACFYLKKILVLSAVQCEVLMHMQCHGRDIGDQNWRSRSRMTQIPEWHKHLETPLRVWIPRWCWVRGGKLGCRHQTVSSCLGSLERKEMEGLVATEIQWGRKIYWNLSPFSHLFPLPSTALAKLPDEFSYSQLLAFSLKSCCALLPDGFSFAPVLPFCQAHH